MDSVTLFWTLLSTLFAGVHLFVHKVVAHEKRSSAFNGMLGYGIAGVIAVSIAIVTSSVPERWVVVGVIALLAGVTHGVGNFVRIESLKYIDSVLYFPISKVLGPLIVLIGGVAFFGDSLTALQYLGVLLSISVPLLLVSSVEKHRQNNLYLGSVYLVVATVLTAGSALLTKQALFTGDAFWFVLTIGQVAGASSSIAILLRQHGREIRRTLVVDFREVYLGVLGGVIGFCSIFSLLKALDTGAVSLVYTINAHYILVPIVLSVWWYGEHISLRKVAAVAVSFLAIALLV